MNAFPIHIKNFRWQLTRQFRWQLLVVLPWFIPLITYLLLRSSYFSDWRIFVGATLLNASLAVGCQIILDNLTRRVVERYPGLHQTVKRLLLLLLVFMVITPIFILGALWGYTYFHWFGFVAQPGVIFRIFLFNLVANIVSVGVFESIYSLTKWRENMLEKEQLRKANLQSQYEGLKNQVNPHFLFNTLNSLSSLIADEPERAEEFVDELAKVYRYLLQTNRSTTDPDGELTTLDTELRFIQSYFHLLKTRYGAGIELEMSVEEADREAQLPPLTLQMLVENAVKHNITHASKPLRIEIKSAPGGYLLVRNNLQRKASRVLSNQVGLNNIKAKYQLLAQRYSDSLAPNGTIAIEETNEYFTLLLPLLSPVARH